MRSGKANVFMLLLCVLLLAGYTFASSGHQIDRRSIGNEKGLQVSDAKAQKLNETPQHLEIQGEVVTPVYHRTEPLSSVVNTLQGGDNIGSATAIPSIPFSDAGTTSGYADDYNESCVGATGNAPDVVYSFTPSADIHIDISLCNSSYMTHLWVYENSTATVVACNRFNTMCTLPRSGVTDVVCTAGNTYYIVIDGENGQNGAYQIDITETPPPPPPTFAGFHPAIGDGQTGYNMVAYEDPTGTLFTDSVLVWFGTADDFGTYSDVVAYNFVGTPTYPGIDYFGRDSVFYGTIVPPATDNSGGATYLMTAVNANDPNGYNLGSWNWTTYGWHDMKMAAIACDSTQKIGATSDYRFGIISMVTSSTYPTTPLVNAPHLFYQTTSATQGTISWYNDLNGCNSTSCDIDNITHFSYAVYDWYNPTDMQWQLFARRDVFGNPNDTVYSGGWTHSLTAGNNIYVPVVAANNGNVLIASEYYADGNESDHDIICWYDPTHTGSLDSLEISVVVASTADERFPQIAYMNGSKFVVTYIADQKLYAVTTLDGGVTWGAPRAISLVDDQVVSEYRADDIAEKGHKIMYEYVDAMGGPDTLLRLLTTDFYNDDDADGYANYEDNCPTISNHDQADADGDNVGDVCDNCVSVANSDQADADNDGIGDVCDVCTDTDGDGFGDPGYPANTCQVDNCPGIPNPDQADADNDGLGDVCDNCPNTTNINQADADADGVGDACDNCAAIANAGQADGDSDGFGDVCDNCPAVANVDQADVDNDGVGDVCDNCVAVANTDQTDGDADNVGDVCDNCPTLTNVDQSDVDVDGVGDVCDNCPTDYNPDQADANHNGIGDVCDGCCVGIRGNADGDGADAVDISDIIFMVEYSFNSGPAPACFEEADVNSDLALDIADIIYLVEYSFSSGPAPNSCL